MRRLRSASVSFPSLVRCEGWSDLVGVGRGAEVVPGLVLEQGVVAEVVFRSRGESEEEVTE